MTDSRTFVIAGASLAGAKAAEALREDGFEGRVVLVGEERSRPYERPPLSKEYLRGEAEREKVFVHPESFYGDHDIELRTGTAVTSIDPGASEVVLVGDERVRFDALLLATGAGPRRLSIPGGDLDGVLYLRDLEDADAIRERIERGGKLVVIGAGWIGAEVAASARERGLDVTIVEQGAVPLERVLGAEVGSVFGDIHVEHGVEMVAGARLEGFEGAGRVERVLLEGGRRLECDLVVVGIGVLPRDDLARRAGLSVENGIVVDEHLRTSVPTIFAAGDVANARHPLYGSLRVEHWSGALHQGPAAARSMLGTGGAYDRVPYFFSDQYDIGMEYAGHARGSDEVVFRGDPGTREFIAFWLQDGRVAAGMNVNVWGVTEAIQALVRSRLPVERSQLADPGISLEDLGTERPSSSSPLAAARKIVSQGAGFPKRFVQGRLAKGEDTPASELAPGEAKVLRIGDDRAAVYRDDEGKLHAVSPVCTHMGCLVGWNSGEKSWDCPCHGARFDYDGRVLQGPAKKPLEEKHVGPTPKAAASRGEGE